MYAVMVKHTPKGKVFWFEAPERIARLITPGVRVACDTHRGRQYGVAVSAALNPADVRDVMLATGATEPLSRIVDVAYNICLNKINVPNYMARTRPSDEKLAKRFLEFYHTGGFQTNIVVDKDYNLEDGYTAYLVAKKLGLDTINAMIKGAVEDYEGFC